MERKYPIEFTVTLSESTYKYLNSIIPQIKWTDLDENENPVEYTAFSGWKVKEVEIEDVNAKDINDIYRNIYECTFSVRMIPLWVPYFNQIVDPVDRDKLSSEVSRICRLYQFPIEFDYSQQDFLRDEQYMFMKNILSKSGGLVQLHTNYGKNTMITYMIKHYKGSGNILIIGPTLSVLSEINKRAKKYGIEIKDNIYAIHAAGFMNSNYKDMPEWIDWLKNVDVVIVDEIENVPSSLEAILQKYCTNYKYIYGFSATANKYNGMKLEWSTLSNLDYESQKPIFSTLYEETKKVIYYFGQCLAYKKSPKALYINTAYGSIPAEHSNPYKGDNANFNAALENALYSESVLKYATYIAINKDQTMLLPVNTNAQGEYFYNFFSELKLPELEEVDGDHVANSNKQSSLSVVFWSGSQILNNIIDPDTGTQAVINTYEELQYFVDNRLVDMLICTKVGYRGVDFQAISDVLLIVGTRNSIVNQIVGRAERYEGIMKVWLLLNKDDQGLDWRNEDDAKQLLTPIFNACNGARLSQLRAGHTSYVNNLGDLDRLQV